MKILDQDSMYTVNDKGTFEIRMDLQAIRDSGYLNFTGLVYSDQKYKVFKNIQGVFSGYAIVTDQDLIAHDQYIETLDKTLPIIFLVNEGPSARSGFDINDKTVYGCSKKRIERAVEKLHNEGFTCVHVAKSIKGVERLIDQAKRGTIKHRALNVINVQFGKGA